MLKIRSAYTENPTLLRICVNWLINSFFFLVSWLRACFLSFFFLTLVVFSWSLSWSTTNFLGRKFLIFLFSFLNSHLGTLGYWISANVSNKKMENWKNLVSFYIFLVKHVYLVNSSCMINLLSPNWHNLLALMRSIYLT